MMKDSTEFRQRFADWKAGKKVYNAGKPITDNEYYDIMEHVAKENWEKWGDSSEDAALTRILNANDYDYRGYYDKYPSSKANADTHWTDEFKTVYHPTFSTESKYSGVKSKFNPEGLVGGSWGEGDKFYPQNWQQFDTKSYHKKISPYDCGKSLKKCDAGWWDDLKKNAAGYAAKAVQFVAPNAYNTTMSVIGGVSKMLHDRQRLLRAAHSSSRGGDSNVESFLFDSNPKDELFYTGSFKLPLNQKGEVFKPDILSSERSNHAPYKERDLVKYAITGDRGSIQDSDPITVNDSTYDRVIDGVIFPYSSITFPNELQSVVDSITASPKPIMSFGPNTNYGDGDGTFQYIDNVANHSGVIKKVNNGFEFVPFDNWDFKGDYKYTGNLPIKINNIFESLIQPNEEYPNSGSFMIKQKGVPIKFDKYGDINFLNWYSTLKGGADTNSATQSMINAIREYKGYDKGKFIHIKPANRGKFNATKKRTGKTTEQLAHSKNPLTRKRAIFALNSRKFKH